MDQVNVNFGLARVDCSFAMPDVASWTAETRCENYPWVPGLLKHGSMST